MVDKFDCGHQLDATGNPLSPWQSADVGRSLILLLLVSPKAQAHAGKPHYSVIMDSKLAVQKTLHGEEHGWPSGRDLFHRA